MQGPFSSPYDGLITPSSGWTNQATDTRDFRSLRRPKGRALSSILNNNDSQTRSRRLFVERGVGTQNPSVLFNTKRRPKRAKIGAQRRTNARDATNPNKQRGKSCRRRIIHSPCFFSFQIKFLKKFLVESKIAYMLVVTHFLNK